MTHFTLVQLNKDVTVQLCAAAVDSVPSSKTVTRCPQPLPSAAGPGLQQTLRSLPFQALELER